MGRPALLMRARDGPVDRAAPLCLPPYCTTTLLEVRVSQSQALITLGKRRETKFDRNYLDGAREPNLDV